MHQTSNNIINISLQVSSQYVAHPRRPSFPAALSLTGSFLVDGAPPDDETNVPKVADTHTHHIYTIIESKQLQHVQNLA